VWFRCGENGVEKKVDILNFLIEPPSSIWVKIYSIILSFTDVMVKTWGEEAKKSRELFKLSGGAIPVIKMKVTLLNPV
jgi:hypothetical protein